MTSIRKWLDFFLSKPSRSLALVLAITILTHLPTGFSSFVADDYMQWAMIKGSPELQNLGFAKADPEKPFASKMMDAFHFFNPTQGTNQAYQDYGNLPWWSNADASMVPFRPIAAITHWVDYTWFGDNLVLHRLHSLVYFVMLAAIAFAFYKRNSSENAIALLATLFLIVDFSLTKSFNWVIARNSYMACAIGIISILAFVNWRTLGRSRDLVFSLVSLAAALLTAEAAISTLAYMGAYVLCVEKHKSIIAKIPPLLPFILVVVLWRLGYSASGFGSNEIGQYVDPVRSPLAFLRNFVEVFPLICISQIVSVDSIIIMIHPEKRIIVSALAWAISILCIYLIWPILKRNPISRFMFVGSIVAAIPGTALISGESRTVTFVSIGFFYLLAQWILTLYQSKESILRRWTAHAILMWHFVLPAIIAFLLTSNLSGFSQQSKQYESIREDMEQGSRSLVIVNDSSAMFYYLPFEWAFRGFDLPTQINILTPGLNTYELSRLSERYFEVRIAQGMPLHHLSNIDSIDGTEPFIHSAYSGLFALGFFTTPQHSPKIGDKIRNSDMLVSILDTNSFGPTLVGIEFVGETDPEDKVWQMFDWKELKYKKMEILSIGDSITITGPLDK